MPAPASTKGSVPPNDTLPKGEFVFVSAHVGSIDLMRSDAFGEPVGRPFT